MVRLRAIWDDIRGSLFWVPAIMFGLGLALGFLIDAIQSAAGSGLQDAVFLIATRPESAVRVFEVIAGASITVAGLVFSVMVVAVQLASTQLSPRVLRGFLRDPRSQFGLGTVTATFAYCLLLLSIGPSPQGQELTPDLSVTIAVALAAASVLALILMIDNTARSMQAGTVVRRVTRETRELIAHVYPHATGTSPVQAADATGVPHGPGHTVTSRHDGWIQQIDAGALLAAMPPGSAIRVDLPVGKFAFEGSPLLTSWPPPEDPDAFEDKVHDAYDLGDQRTMIQDVMFGLRQMVDISLRALSPAINDPGTAYEVIENLGAVLADLLRRDLTPRIMVDDEQRRLYQPRLPDHAQYLHLAFEQIRLSAAPHPAVSVAMLNVLERLSFCANAEGPVAARHIEALRHQAELIVASVETQRHIDSDLQRVYDAAADLGVETSRV